MCLKMLLNMKHIKFVPWSSFPQFRNLDFPMDVFKQVIAQLP